MKFPLINYLVLAVLSMGYYTLAEDTPSKATAYSQTQCQNMGSCIFKAVKDHADCDERMRLRLRRLKAKCPIEFSNLLFDGQIKAVIYGICEKIYDKKKADCLAKTR